LEFYITAAESHCASLKERPIQEFIKRMQHIWSQAQERYHKILQNQAIVWKNENHVRAVAAVCLAFQDFSFVRSATSDLYQLVFYNFANKFKRGEAAQFLTPLPVIEFLVRIVNPRNGETLFDPCCGIADFLSLSYVHAQGKTAPWKLDDANIYGVDLDESMLMLATLNMLLNGDGEAKLFVHPNPGSILYKVAMGSPPQLVALLPDYHKDGNWDNWPDRTQLLKFNVVLTNPPFGEDRAFRPRTAFERKMLEMYQAWQFAGGNKIDLGILFLENAYRCLADDGRLGIVLSNSIASINDWKKVRLWLMDRMRIVALFDLPANVFAETGANTTLIIAYKPSTNALKKLNRYGYSIFVRDIQNVGYEKRTLKRNVFFKPVYKFDQTTFQVQTDTEGRPILEEDFTKAVADFQQWAFGQEEVLQKGFLAES
jgi:type I restriction enzyme M protein